MNTLNAQNLRILAIGAHPDDVELGCGGSLAKLSQAGAEVRALVFSRGRRGVLNEADRGDETRQALQVIGVSDVRICNFEDTRLSMALNEMVTVIEDEVRVFRPNRVYTMFQFDRHQDHRAVYEASSVACRSVEQLLGYETPSSYPNFTPTVFEEVGTSLELKMAALKCHQSQGDRLYMQEDKVRSAAHFRGAQVSLGPCEGFISYKLIL
jgi:LmbE family N-acetylglucosaminyl deacetylase